MTRVKRMALVETPESAPRYEVRVRGHRLGDTEYEIWQMPSAATPQVASATHIAGLRGRNLELVEHRVLKRLGGRGHQAGSELAPRKTRLRPHGRLGADPGLVVPGARAHAQPRQHAGGG